MYNAFRPFRLSRCRNLSSQSKKGYYNNYVTDKDNFLNVVETINGGCWTYETYLFEKNGIMLIPPKFLFQDRLQELQLSF